MKKRYSLVISILAISLSAAALAAPVLYAQRCDLGGTCPIPGNDQGITYFNINPAQGTDYECTVNSDKGELSFWIYGGKDFELQFTFHSANPQVVVEVKGNFTNATDPADVGQIKIQRTNDGTGNVVCVPTGLK